MKQPTTHVFPNYIIEITQIMGFANHTYQQWDLMLLLVYFGEEYHSSN